MSQIDLFDPNRQRPSDVAEALDRSHYLGAARRGIAYRDMAGVLVFAKPTSRMLPSDGTWLELSRWCLDGSGDKRSGSQQWARAWRWLASVEPRLTTVVSYSDPSAGHSGSLYRACNWLWAPTWHRLRPPPSGLGSWDGETMQAVKDRWVFPVAEDPCRMGVLRLADDGLRRRMPWAEYQEPRFRRGRPVGGTGGGDYKRWASL